jgi:hypothetical protein
LQFAVIPTPTYVTTPRPTLVPNIFRIGLSPPRSYPIYLLSDTNCVLSASSLELCECPCPVFSGKTLRGLVVLLSTSNPSRAGPGRISAHWQMEAE